MSTVIKRKKRQFTIVGGKIVATPTKVKPATIAVVDAVVPPTIEVKAKSPVKAKKKQAPPTEAEQKKARQQITMERKRKRIDILNKLNASFPEAFNPECRNPLKVGIRDDLIEWAKEHEVPAKRLKRVIKYYVSRLEYFQATLQETHRVDLQGNLVGEVDDRSREYAQEQLEEIQKLREQSRNSRE